MRLLFAGTPEVALPSLDALAASRHELVAVLTRPEAPSGRGRHAQPSPVAVRAAEFGLPVLTPSKPSEPEFGERLRELAPDCCPVVAYGALLPQRVLDVPALGWVNLHFSLLPAWRGAAPVQHAVLGGDEVTGATTFQIVKELDAGPTLGSVTEPIRPTDTAGALLERLAVAGAPLLVDTIDHLELGDLRPQAQPDDGVSYAGKIETADARIRWTDPAFAVDRRIRACTPSPGAWTTLDDRRLKLGPVRLVPDVDGLAPGEIEVGRDFVHAGTATHAVALGDVQPPGKRPMDAAAWARGARLEGRVRLGIDED
ncbi:MAG TPA: methionyl-tRNA formyltransferase [Nocardioidaceae bacterium]|nr:methionyl-tRNA formyltransferase [Nocardioidaceae bacterium]